MCNGCLYSWIRYACGGRHIIVAGDTLSWREMLECGGKYIFIGHNARGDKRFPPFLQWFNTDAVNGIIVHRNTSSRNERIQQEMLYCL
jgi:hypothetical protein